MCARTTPSVTARSPVHARRVSGLADIAQDDWDRLFPGRAENWGYFRACERAEPSGFTTSAIGVYDGNGLIAATPLFRTDFRLDTSRHGVLQRWIDWVHSTFPGLVSAPVLGIGSPLTEECPLGFDATMTGREREATFKTLLDEVEHCAAAEGISLIALKDVTDRDNLWAAAPLRAAGYAAIPTLPIAVLHLPFASVEEYLASLSLNMRHSLKRKMKGAGDIDVEFRTSIDGVEHEIAALFKETHDHRKADYGAFDDVPEAYFREVLAAAGSAARVMLCRVKGELVSFNIHLIERERVLAKYIGMRYPQAREHNLYFVNWMAMVGLCIERGIPWLQAGQTAYQQKARFGCQLRRSWIWCKHRNPLINPLFKLIGPHMGFDKTDPDLQALGSDAKYLDPSAVP